ncbi:MAG: hypothetical protein ACQEV0_08425 [Bacillota bacterium]
MTGILSVIIAIFTLVFGIFVSVNALDKKTDISQALFTDEQKMKVHYYRLFMLSSLISLEAFVIPILFLIKSGDFKTMTDPSTLVSLLFFSLTIFVLCLLSLGRIAKWFQNFFVTKHFKYQITLSNRKKVYIIRMLNPEICICSEDPNAGFSKNIDDTYLVPIDRIIEKLLIRKEFPKPTKTFIQKFFY